jgi:hypothetical protein
VSSNDFNLGSTVVKADRPNPSETIRKSALKTAKDKCADPEVFGKLLPT